MNTEQTYRHPPRIVAFPEGPILSLAKTVHEHAAACNLLGRENFDALARNLPERDPELAAELDALNAIEQCELFRCLFHPYSPLNARPSVPSEQSDPSHQSDSGSQIPGPPAPVPSGRLTGPGEGAGPSPVALRPSPPEGLSTTPETPRQAFERRLRADIIHGALKIAAQLAPVLKDSAPRHVANVASDIAAYTVANALRVDIPKLIPPDR